MIPGIACPNAASLGEELQHTVFDLLHHIRNAVGPVNLHEASILID